MKKVLIILGLVTGLFISTTDFAYSAEPDIQKIQTITEIGTLSNQEKYTEALEKCTTAMKKYPDDYELYYWSASIKMHTGEAKAAIADYNRAIELKPEDSSLYVMRGIAKSEIHDNEGAIEDFNHALKINPKDSSAYSMRACVKIEMGDLKGANEDLETANKLFGNEK